MKYEDEKARWLGGVEESGTIGASMGWRGQTGLKEAWIAKRLR
jgi:hypothetical protein